MTTIQAGSRGHRGTGDAHRRLRRRIRRAIRWSVFLLVAAVWLSGTGAPDVAARAADSTPPSVPTGLSATAPTPYRVNLTWGSATDDVAVASYTIYRGGIRIGSVAAPATNFLDGASRPSSAYTYRVDAVDSSGNRSAKSVAARVTTPAASGDPTIAAAGDIACDPAGDVFKNGFGTQNLCRAWYTSEVLRTGGFDGVLALGDNQYQCGGYQAFLQSYDRSWGRVNAIAYPAVGNHEYDIVSTTPGGWGTDCPTARDASGYFKYFGGVAGHPLKGYYSFNIGSWHFIALNSNCGFVSCAPGSAQEQWLQNDLATHPTRCTLAFWHHPRFSTGSGEGGDNPMVGPFWSDLYTAHADVVLNGHAHFYERFARQDPTGDLNLAGLREFVAGTGGKSHGPVSSTPKANSQIVENATYGVLELTLHPRSYDWRFVPASPGTFTDSGHTSCS